MFQRLICTMCTAAGLWFAGPAVAEEVLLGLGYDRTRDGHGFDLHKLGDTYILYFYTYDAQGDPEWFLGVAQMDSGVLAGELQRYRYDASAEVPSVRDGSFSGEFRLDFTRGFASQACNDGTSRNDAIQISELFWRVGDESGLWCTEFLPTGRDHNRSPYYGGVWYAGEEDSGYGFTMTHMDDTVTSLVYYYDDNGDPRWALGAASDSTATVELRSFEGYCRTCTPRPTRTVGAGTVYLDWSPGLTPGRGDDLAEIDLSYPNAPGGDFFREFTLRRISDGQAIGTYQVDFRLSGLVQYVVAWQEVRDDNLGTEVSGTTEFGVPQADQRLASAERTQTRPAVGIAADGSYVVTWEDDTDGNGFYQVRARGFYADGREKFGAITVNSEGAGQQRYPDIGVAANGDFVVVWEDDADGNGFGQILARGFDDRGRERIADFTVNSEGAGHQMEPAIDMAADGAFVVAWSDDQDANEFYDIAVRGFYASGSQRFSQRTVNTTGSGQQWQPDVAVADNGNFVVVWTDDADMNHFTQVLGRGFVASGSERFPTMTLHQSGTASQYHPSVAMAPSGSFAVAWVDQGKRIGTRGFLSTGAPVFDDVYVNNDTLPLHRDPTIGVAEDGSLVLVWSYLRDDGLFRLGGRAISPGGQVGSELLVSLAPDASQVLPVISVR